MNKLDVSWHEISLYRRQIKERLKVDVEELNPASWDLIARMFRPTPENPLRLDDE